MVSKKNSDNIPASKLVDEKEIALDFATKIYQKFDKMIKSVVLFGSQAKNTATSGSDIDLIIIIDDASILWDQELIAWYREELGKIIKANPYKKDLHINTIKLTTWWSDMKNGDPLVINIIRFGEAIIDFGGFFTPLKVLLQEGRITSTPEAIYSALQRVPSHIARSKISALSSIEGLHWAMVDASQAALMAAKKTPPSPEHIPIMLKEAFVDSGQLKMKYVIMFRDLYVLHRKIVHGEVDKIKGQEVDDWTERTQDFFNEMVRIVKDIVDKK